MAGDEGVEPSSRGPEPRTLPLSYQPIGSGGGNRTLVNGLMRPAGKPTSSPLLVEVERVELSSSACRADALPLSYTPPVRKGTRLPVLVRVPMAGSHTD